MIACALDSRVQTIAKLGERLRRREISPVELTAHCLAAIEKLNPVLNAFVTVAADTALEQARAAEREILQGNWRGPLHGIPIGIKDLIDTAGIRTTAASGVMRDRVPGEDAEVVRRLKAAGAVILGKQNLHEFAYGGSSLVSYFGDMHNPWKPEHIAGGSSGGSAAAVGAGLGFAAIGTDTAGSIREPAAFCGVVGLKPTYGRVSNRGVIPLSPSLDHTGPLTRSVEDAATVLAVIADAGVGGALPFRWGEANGGEAKKLRVGTPTRFFFDDLHREVASAIQHALEVVATMVSSVEEVEVPVSTDRTLQNGESYQSHAAYLAQMPELYQPETIRRLRAGENISSQQVEALRAELDTLRRRVPKMFGQADVLLTPTMPVPAPSIRSLKENPDQLRPAELLMLRNTRPANVWGIPAISLPCGFTQDGLPIGMQLMARPGREDALLSLAWTYQEATTWHKRRPPISAEWPD